LAGAINDTHAAPSDLVEDFVIAQAPLPVRDVDFIEDVFESRLRHPGNGFQTRAQKAADTNS
jgi:hypothetical protein